MIFIRKSYLLLLLLLLSKSLFAQQITEQFNNVELQVIVETLSLKYPSTLFYKSTDLPTIRKTVNWSSITLVDAIADLLSGTELTTIHYRGDCLVILPKSSLDTAQLSAFYVDFQKRVNANSIAGNEYVTIGSLSKFSVNPMVDFTGSVTDALNSEEIIGATVSVDGVGTSTDATGQFGLQVENGVKLLKVQYVGYQDYIAKINFLSSGRLEIVLQRNNINLDEVTITAYGKDAGVRETQVGVNRVDLKALDKMPSFMGEKDVVKAILLNPGVSTIGEGSTGFNVRGGNVDQNLVMQDEAILFNSAHALGFFSTFNADLIKDAFLSKGNFASDYGGRLASAFRVNLKDGNTEKIRLKGSINPAAATISVDGPINAKSSYIAGIRTTFSDYIFGFFEDVDLKNSRANFYDANLKYTIKTKKNIWSVSGYLSADEFKFSNQFGFGYGTKLLQSSWQHIFSSSQSNRLSVVISDYQANQTDFKGNFSSVYSTGIRYYKLMDKWTKVWSGHKIDAGLTSIYYTVNPGRLDPYNERSFQPVLKLENEDGLESSIFLNYEKELFEHFEVIAGIRYNNFLSLGPQVVNQYLNNVITSANLNGKEVKGGILKSYHTLEPRLSMKYQLLRNSSIKFGYAKTSQFINQIFNADTPTPSNQWQLSSPHIKPFISNNFSLGYFLNLQNNDWELSLEGYFRNISRLYDYKDFAKLVVNTNIETELLEGIGRARGIEVSIKKNEGKLYGWLSYTYANSLQKIAGINRGNWFPSGYDKPHNLSVIANFQPRRRHTFSANFTYSTGRPSTAPISNYLTVDEIYVPVYSERNQLRIADYHRLDVSYNVAKSHNEVSRITTSWTFTLYNVYARKNPFSIFYTRGVNNTPQANRLAVVGTVIPAIRFNIEFH